MATRTLVKTVQKPIGKNIIINGAMDHWQRGTSFLTEGTANTTLYFADRFWLYTKFGLSRDITQEAHTEDNLSPYWLKVERSLAGTGPTGNDWLNLTGHAIEGNTMAHVLGKTVTLSFKVQSNVTGNHVLTLRNPAGNRSYATTYSIDSADVPQKIVLQIPIEAGTYNTDNTAGLFIRFGNQVGTDFHTGTTDAWQTGDFYGVTGQAQLFENTNDYFQITQMKLEEGSEVTEFSRAGETFAEELKLCMRYYERTGRVDPNNPLNFNSRWGSFTGRAITTSRIVGNFRYKVRKRTNPAVTIYSTQGTAGSVGTYNATATVGTSYIIDNNTASADSFGIATGSASLTIGNQYSFHATIDAEL